MTLFYHLGWTLLLTLFSFNLLSQNIELNNRVYDKNVKSVKFHINGLPMSQPVVDLGTSGRLLLTFDDVSEYEVDYFYTIVHCTADWEKSDIQDLLYLQNYDEGEIENYLFSGSTEVPYTHYMLRLPNEEVGWKISGNYVLIVYYYDNGERVPVFTRRFMVTESLVGITANFRYPTNAEHLKTHHEMGVEVNTYNLSLRSPETQLRLYVYQNGRWDEGLLDKRYDRYFGNLYKYDLPGKITFPAYKEFRHVNARFINSPSGDFASLQRDEQGYYAVLLPDRTRLYDNYHTYFDLNGQYIIQNREEPIKYREVVEYNTTQVGDTAVTTETVTTESYVQDEHCLRCEYMRVVFSLDADEPFDEDVYIFGEFTGWRLDPLYKMEYSPLSKAYFAEVLLKQGYYDYFYALDKEGEIDTYTLEGSWHETENDYLILVYDRHPFNQYDRLIGVRMVNSNQ